MFLIRKGPLLSTDEILSEIDFFTSDEEYIDLMQYLLEQPTRTMRKALKDWALASENSFVKAIGEWM